MNSVCVQHIAHLLSHAQRFSHPEGVHSVPSNSTLVQALPWNLALAQSLQITQGIAEPQGVHEKKRQQLWAPIDA